jgi:anti-repressor protein
MNNQPNNQLQIFKNQEFGKVRVLNIEGDPWFVAKDVCDVLEIDSSQTRRLDDDEKGLRSIQTPGGNQEMQVVNEPGLYSLVLGSRKPQAKAFKRWITHDVIPSIRKTGKYEIQHQLPQTFAEALRLANAPVE